MNTHSPTNSQFLPDLTTPQSQPHPEPTSTAPHPEGLDNRISTATLSALSSNSPFKERDPTNYLDTLPAFVQNHILSFLEYLDLRRTLPAFTTFQNSAPECLLERFGLPRLERDNKETFSTRINIILNTLKKSSILNSKEKASFDRFTAEKLFTERNTLFSVLDSAYNCSLIAPFWEQLSYFFPQNATLNQKALYVRMHIERNKESIVKLFYIDEEMTCFPDEFCSSLSYLNWLNLKNNQLFSLPKSIKKLSTLSWLSLSNKRLSSLTESIGRLSALTTLELPNNQLLLLPEAIGELSELESLNLSENRLSSLPESFGQLSKLKELSLNSNKFNSIPELILTLSMLESLDLSDNQLSFLPKFIDGLSTLNQLNLSHNQLFLLPKSIEKLSTLETLNLSFNQLFLLPVSFGNLSVLNSLYLSNNRLFSLPESIKKLSELDRLVLSDNQLSSLPKSIGALSALRTLYVDNNCLTSLPKSFTSLSALWLLNLDNNQLSSLPENVKQFLEQKGIDPDQILSHQIAKEVNSPPKKRNRIC